MLNMYCSRLALESASPLFVYCKCLLIFWRLEATKDVDRNMFLFLFFLKSTFTKPNLWKIKLDIPFCVLLLDIIHAYFLFEMKREKISTTSKVLGFNDCLD